MNTKSASSTKLWGSNVSLFHASRQQNSGSYLEFQRRCYVNDSLIRRLSLSGELEGHNGCVNCIQWNHRGTMLASGSDDYQIILWDPFKGKKIHAIRTAHVNNIFAVQFVPDNEDRIILSGAGDSKIRMHDINRGSGDECVQVYNCHFARVKRIAVTPAHPFLFWSAGEDGIVMELDVRVPASCQNVCDHALINLNAHTGLDAEVKCIAINPARPELLAVGANDPYIRVFDRRMLSKRRICMSPTDGMDGVSPWERAMPPLIHLNAENEDYSLPSSSTRYYCAGHLPVKQKDFRKKYRPLATTYLTFGPEGNDLLVNLGGEQIYLFDIRSPGERKSLLSVIKDKIATSVHLQHSTSSSRKEGPCLSHQMASEGNPASNGYHVTNGQTNGYSTASNANGVSNGHSSTRFLPPPEEKEKTRRVVLPHRAEALKQQANSCFEQGSYTDAIELYSAALTRAPHAPVLWANRAAAYMKRAWDGDVYAALRDCFQTLEMEPEHLKALFRLARCLYELKHPVEAQCCLELFKRKYPEHSKSPAFSSLDRDIKDVLFSEVNCESNGKSGSVSTRKRSRKGMLREEEMSGGSDESDSPGTSSMDPPEYRLSEQEQSFRNTAVDYDLRFCGHCNTTTDIKEANFLGSYGEYIVAGSDDGTFFIWERKTCKIVSVLRGDESIVNCLQPHPTHCLLATSGIESNIKLWSPAPENGSDNKYLVTDVSKTATANQRRMNADPLEVMLFNMGYRIGGGGYPGGGSPQPTQNRERDPDPSADSNVTTIQCRQS